MSSMHPSDHRIISERYFFPRKTPAPGPALVDVDVGEATLACARIDGGHERTLLHFHGNGEVVADYLPAFPAFVANIGLNTFLAEYRGYGGSTGVPQLGAMLDDIDAIVEAASGPDQLVVFGRSIGSIYAIETVKRYPQVLGLVIESGIADVLERILLRASPHELGISGDDLRASFVERFDHEAKLRSYKGPVLILHAEHDHLVSVAHARQNAAWVQGPCTLEVLPRGDHNSIFIENQPRYLNVFENFVRSL